MASRVVSNRLARAAVGLAISAAFVAITLSRIDLEELGHAWASVAAGLVALAVAISVVEVSVRAVRWRILLRPLADPGFPATLGFLAIGHLANALLPARLGDVARGFVAGSRLGVSRASVLGTIAVERISDAALLGVAASAGIAVGYTSLTVPLLVLAAAGLAAALVLGVATVVLGRQAVAATRVGGLLLHHGSRFVAGASSLRNARQLAAIGILTAASFGLAVLLTQVVGASLGVTLPVWQAALVMAAATLSTAIPAGPASLGTYEFVGMTVMASMGFPLETSLVTVGLVHLVVTLTPSVMGLVAMWAMGIGPIASRLGTRAEGSAPGRAA